MNWTLGGTRPRALVVGTLAVVVAVGAATLTLVPALAGNPVPAQEAYVELNAGLQDEQQHALLVDGDEATPDPQQNIESLDPLTLVSDPELLTIGAEADPATILGGTSCAGAPIDTLPPVAPLVHIRNILDWVGKVPWLGVRSYRCALLGSPGVVVEDNLAFIVPGETLEIASGADVLLPFRSVKLPITASNASAVRATATLDGEFVGSIVVDMATCVPKTNWNIDELNDLCSTRVYPVFGPQQNRYLNLNFPGPFDSLALTTTSGAARITGHFPSRFYLDGEVFGGTIGGETGDDSLSEPPTDTLPGYEVSCADAASPPPEGPCEGKEVSLAIARYLADIDGDGDDEQVLDVVPSGPGEQRVRLSMTIFWAPEAAPAGAIPRSGFDEDEDGPDDNDPASWCSQDPPGPPEDEWCLETFTSDSADGGKIQVTEHYEGTGDPKGNR